MSAVRLCMLFLVIFVQYQFIATKPFFDDFWCDLLCEDDDVSTISSSTSGSNDICAGCSSTTSNVQFPPVFNISLPASSGMTMTLNNVNGVWGFGLVANPVATPPPVTPPPVVTTPAATTPAAAAAAAGATTVAATTAKK